MPRCLDCEHCAKTIAKPWEKYWCRARELWLNWDSERAEPIAPEARCEVFQTREKMLTPDV